MADRREHIENFKAAVANASPSETRAGNRWYAKAHRDAVHSGQDMAPGIKLNHPSGNGVQVSPVGIRARHQYRAEHPDTDIAGLIHDKRNSPETVRAAGEIAASSPASPAGMDWEKNAQAAYEGARMTPEQYHGVKRASEASHGAMVARGALKAAENRGEPTAKLSKNVAKAKTNADTVSEQARQPFKGRATNFAGNENLAKTYEIHHGGDPEKLLNPRKTGHFRKAILGDNEGITVDEHMANILGGRTQWKLKKKGAPQTVVQDRTIPPVARQAGYDYAKGVIHEGSQELGKEAPKAQAVGWLHEKNVKNAAENAGEVGRRDKARSTINKNVSNRLMKDF